MHYRARAASAASIGRRLLCLVLALTAGGALAAAPVAPDDQPVPAIAPKAVWDHFTVLVWQYKTSATNDLPLYHQVNIHGFHIDRGAGKEAIVAFARENKLPYYADHSADKGILHLTPASGRDSVLHKTAIVERPHCLVDPKTIDLLRGHLRRNITVTRDGEGHPVSVAIPDDLVPDSAFWLLARSEPKPGQLTRSDTSGFGVHVPEPAPETR